MRIQESYISPNRTRISPDETTFRHHNLNVYQGAQILKTPAGSSIIGMTLKGGASFEKPWATLRGAVLKFSENRPPIEIKSNQFLISTGYTLMDMASFIYTRDKRNAGAKIPFRIVNNISAEPLYMVHASYCHPDQLFLPQGTFTFAQFSTEDVVGIRHFVGRNTLTLIEDKLPFKQAPFNIFEGLSFKPYRIIVQLAEGGHIVMANSKTACFISKNIM
jgi:hypothetical protein